MQKRINFTLIALWCFALSSHAQTEDPHASLSATEFFQTSDQCIACHSNLTSTDGRDVSIGYAWRASMMANSARDPYWHAAVRREVMDHPGAQAAIENECSTCHMPMHQFTAEQAGGQGQVLANIGPGAPTPARVFAADGVSCTVCHQIQAGNFGQPASFTGGFLIDTTTPAEQRSIFGPHAVDAGRQRTMQSAARFVPAETTHMQESELCATCHTLFTHTLDDDGNVIGELAEQVPYLEWQHSAYRTTRSCQGCHMPELGEDTAISSVLGQPRPNFSQHVFRGGNAFMLGILNEHRAELGVEALPQELNASISRTLEYLSTYAAELAIESIELSGQTLAFDVVVTNLAGHKLPTAYPSRRVWLHVRVADSAGRALFESGALRADGSIAGNDNDADGSAYEPHYESIERSDQVQIYEPILADPQGRVTTGLLTAIRYAKDNRILPRGFDKHAADDDIAVFGTAATDQNFTGGTDRVGYRVTLQESPARVDVEVRLLFQTIGYRWAQNLADYDTPETNRFVSYYAGAADRSAVELASTSHSVDR